jgi:hypothetical protein
VTNKPELRRLAEDVRGTGEPQILRRDGEDLAVVVPMAPGQEIGARRAKTTEDLAAFRAAADSWKRGRPGDVPPEQCGEPYTNYEDAEVVIQHAADRYDTFALAQVTP